MRGHVEIARHESRLLAGNPLGDATIRELGVYLPPSYLVDRRRRFPVVYLLSGFTGAGPAQLLQRSAFTPTLYQRLDALAASSRFNQAILVFPDCFTRYGGSQYVDSPAIGRYQSYLTEELLGFVDRRYRTIPRREARAVVGKSSGGYGALRLGMLRPDLFAAVGAHAGDAAFDLCYGRNLPQVALHLERAGGIPKFLTWFDAQPHKPGWSIDVMNTLCCAAAWSPRARGPYGYGRGFDFPMDLSSGVVLEPVWRRWLAQDPVRMLKSTSHSSALERMRAVYLDAGRSDEYFLQYAMRQVAARLGSLGGRLHHEEFDGGHMGTTHRYDRSITVLTAALEREATSSRALPTATSPRRRRAPRA